MQEQHFIVRGHMCNHQVIISDQDREFVNAVQAEVYKLTDTEHCMSSAYHPQTNRLTERFNQTLQTALVKLVNNTQNDFKMMLTAHQFL